MLLPLSSIWPQADVLKVGHHGSKHSSTGEWLDAVQARVAIISAGYENRYDHPHNETLDRLIARDIAIFRTDIHEEFIDDIVATTDGFSLNVKQLSTGQTWLIPESSFILAVFFLTMSLCRSTSPKHKCPSLPSEAIHLESFTMGR